MHYPVRAVLLHALLVVLSGLWAFGQGNGYLYNGLDGAYYRVMAEREREWEDAGPSYHSNPLQGLGDIGFMLKLGLLPSFRLARLLTGDPAHPGVTYTVSSLVLFWGSLFTGACLRVPFLQALWGAWLSILLLAPFLGISFCYPLAAMIPCFPELVALGLVSVGLGACLGRGSPGRTALVVAAQGVLLLYAATAAPLWFILCFPAVVAAWAGLVVGAADRRERTHRVIALGCLVPLLLGLAPYLAGWPLGAAASGFAREFAVPKGPAWLRQTILLFWTQYHAFPYLTVASLLGAGVALARPDALRPLASFHLAWVALLNLAQSGLYALDVPYSGPMLIYFDLVMLPAYAVLGAHFVLVAWDRLGRRAETASGGAWQALLRLRRRFADHPHLPVVALPLCACLCVSAHGHWKGNPPWPTRAEGDIVKTLIRESALQPPDAPFRGSVATVTTCGKDPVSWSDQHFRDWNLCREVGNDHRLVGLWEYNIPTLFEYNQALSPGLYFMTSRMLSRPQDPQTRNVLLLSHLRVPYLRSLGVRFVITDFPAERAGRLRASSSPEGLAGVMLHLYELEHPNLGDYSPTDIIVEAKARATLHLLRGEEFDFERTVVLAAGEVAAPLVRARRSSLRWRTDGVLAVEAEAEGTALLLLPLLYSHCLELRSLQCDSPIPPRLVRANLMQAALCFSGRVRVELQFAYGPFRNPFGRLQDYRDFKRAGLFER